MSYKKLNPTLIFRGVRLPDTAFKKIAGTRVTTDLLFFQKDQAKNLHEEELVFSGSIPFESDKRVWINPYFDGKYNTQVLGEYEVRNFNGGTLNVKGNQKHSLLTLWKH